MNMIPNNVLEIDTIGQTRSKVNYCGVLTELVSIFCHLLVVGPVGLSYQS